ncbi:MAG: RNA 2',3'-cyclic phosphodiesterase [Lentisphaerae bacterium]|nr:RNA 2',3'-cyclic phosphodiesterase [Lentisphaerota bacterium]
MHFIHTQLPAFVRLFIGLPINKESQNKLILTQYTLAETKAHVSWISGDNLHLSLAFLGDMDSSMLDDIIIAMNELISTNPFAYEIHGVHYFGRPNSPKVIIARVSENEALTSLHRNIDAVLESLGVPAEKHPFQPHITLGRVRSARGRADLIKAIETVHDTWFGKVDAQSVYLFRSQLMPHGAAYSVLHETVLPSSLQNQTNSIL